MKSFRLRLLGVLTIFSLVTSAISSPAQEVEPKAWQDHMRSLSNTLVDAFPFLYSTREYELPANKKKIIESLTKLASVVHTLPLRSGEQLVGEEPLLSGATLSIKDQANEAIRLYNENEFALSQSKVFSAVQKCFACHAAHQVGPHFPTTNSEVMGLATPNVLGKAIVFGALRQFDGVTQLIERAGQKSISKKAPASDDLVKLYLIVSLRSQQDFAKALDFVDRVEKMSAGSPILKKWKGDIASWRTLNAEKDEAKATEFIVHRKKSDEGRKDDSLFVVRLFESFVLHRLPLSKASSAQIKAIKFRQLAEAYEGIEFAPFVDLPGIYYRACEKAAPESAAGKQCHSKLLH